MAWIREEDLDLANIIKVTSINPAAMWTVERMNGAITFGSSALMGVQGEVIATTVSVMNKCRF